MKIEKKILPEYFQAILDGKKNFELRMADWECNEGDIIVLKEWNSEIGEYTGRELEKEITYVLRFKVDELFWSKEEIEEHGLMILSLK